MLELIRSGRFWRMCVKELRETLRDRRTLYTLILMPLLVYPLLSMALQRLILNSDTSASSENYLVGVSDDAEVEILGETIVAGQKWQASETYRAFQIEGNNLPKPSPESRRPMAIWKVIVHQELNAQLAAGRIDLVVHIVDPKNSLSEPASTDRSPDVSCRFEVRYRSGDGTSEAALYAFQRLLQSINEQQAFELRQQLGLRREAKVELFAISIGGRPSLMSSAASIIPLVLLLMTITGAVYPAIDLTAGERERGTMEALISTPVPRFGLLLSKYAAVLCVSILTALVNLTAMFVTLNVGGLGRAILGSEGLPWNTLLQILPLLILFSGFFSSILLALCCVARSFKEAQAYLIPIMLLSLGPGVLSVLPGIHLTANMAVVPLFNMILLARDVLTGQAQWLPAIITVATTVLYSMAVMAIAARLFGRYAVASSAEASWSGIWRPSPERNKAPSLGDLSVFLAIFFPIYYVASNSIGVAEDIALDDRLKIKASLTLVLFLGMPIIYAWWRGLEMSSTFCYSGMARTVRCLPGLLLLAGSVWILAHEVFVFSEWLGIASLRPEQLAAAGETKLALQQLPLLLIWLTMAIVPAIAEETFFRGFALRCLESTGRPAVAIAMSAILFGLFHVLSGSVLAVERFLPTALLGWLLAWLAWRTHSLIPGIIVHAGHNGLLFTIASYEDALRAAGWGIDDQRHLPLTWISCGIMATILGVGYIRWLIQPPR